MVHWESQRTHEQFCKGDTVLVVSSFQRVGVCSRYAAYHSKHHPNFWYRPYMRNVVLIQVLVCPLTGEGPKQRLHLQDGDE